MSVTIAPPSGLADLIGDAETVETGGPRRSLSIPEIGVVSARRPGPSAAAMLAAAADSRTPERQRAAWMNRFVTDHLDPASLTDLVVDLMTDIGPDEPIRICATALSTWGTARPHHAVISLCAITGQYWRMLRAKMLGAGTGDPMSLPSLHNLLDFTESTILEAMANGADSTQAAERDQNRFLGSLYRPLPGQTASSGSAGPPAGFDEQSTRDSFDDFVSSLS